jgi:hypothetical protein
MNKAVGRVRRLACALCLALVTASCTPYRHDLTPDPGTGLERVVELAETPFFPQDDYQCGPASLATVLVREGIDVSPPRVRPLLYTPGRKGSLQAEMLAAPGHFGYIGVRIPPTLDSLLQEVASGQPVVVLQNLGRSWWPVWHYAVVFGYDLQAGELHLRSGDRRRRTYSLHRFMQSWADAGNWAMVVVAPGRVPASARAEDYLRGVGVLERLGRHVPALRAYRAASDRWPDNFVAHAGAGNAAYALSRYEAAERAYREALSLKPEAASVMNNLALALSRQGCRQAALAAVECALARAPDHLLFAASRDEIRAAPPGERPCAPPPCTTTAP